jgi:hypothetical protein
LQFALGCASKELAIATKKGMMSSRIETRSAQIPESLGNEFDTVYANFSGWKLFFDRSGWSQAALSMINAESFLSRAKAPSTLTPL